MFYVYRKLHAYLYIINYHVQDMYVFFFLLTRQDDNGSSNVHTLYLQPIINNHASAVGNARAIRLYEIKKCSTILSVYIN